MEVPENFTEEMIDMDAKEGVTEDKENNLPKEENKKRIRFMMSGVSDEERIK